jgi:hypothetical protein
VVPLAGVATEWVPLFPASVTVLPFSGLLFASSSVTVMVDVAVPFAVTLNGLAVTDELLTLTTPSVKVTVAFVETVILSVTSVAW